MKNIRIILSAIVLLSIASCEKQKSMNVICLVDFSKTIEGSTVNWYKKTIEEGILRKEGFKDRLTVLPIDFGSQTASEEIFKVDFSKNNYENEFAGLQADEVKMKNHQDSIGSAIKKFNISFSNARITRAGFDKGTDIFGALKQAEKYFDPEKVNLIVVFSDMLQFTDKTRMNFENHLNSSDEIEKHLSIADKADLSNIQVIVLTGVQSNIRPEKFNVVKSFWEKYFQNCNGNLIDYSSGAVTRMEELISNQSQ